MRSHSTYLLTIITSSIFSLCKIWNTIEKENHRFLHVSAMNWMMKKVVLPDGSGAQSKTKMEWQWRFLEWKGIMCGYTSRKDDEPYCSLGRFLKNKLTIMFSFFASFLSVRGKLRKVVISRANWILKLLIFLTRVTIVIMRRGFYQSFRFPQTQSSTNIFKKMECAWKKDEQYTFLKA